MSDTTPAKVIVPRCPTCGASMQIRAQGITVRIVCANCGSLLDARSETLKLVAQYAKAEPSRPLLLEIGQRGLVRGVTFEVIGALEKAEGSYSWHEYLLFNPTRGLRWLIHQEGHWSFGEAAHDSALDRDNRARVAGEVIYQLNTYRCYHRGRSVVKYVLGEFSWRVKVGDRSTTVDYIAPPRMLSLETTDSERHWTLLEYLPIGEIEKAFGLSLSESAAVVPHMPNPVEPTFHKFSKAAVALVLLLCGAHYVATRDVQPSTALSQRTQLDDAYVGRSIALGPFDFSGRDSPVQISTSAPLSNQWLDLDYSLVNEATQDHFDIHQGIEYYSGVDSDGSWSEGSSSAESRVGAVPAGRYTLLVDAASGDFMYPRFNDSVSIVVERGIVVNEPFWIVLALLLCGPAWYYWRYREFEKARWSDSENSPYSED